MSERHQLSPYANHIALPSASISHCPFLPSGLCLHHSPALCHQPSESATRPPSQQSATGLCRHGGWSSTVKIRDSSEEGTHWVEGNRGATGRRPVGRGTVVKKCACLSCGVKLSQVTLSAISSCLKPSILGFKHYDKHSICLSCGVKLSQVTLSA